MLLPPFVVAAGLPTTAFAFAALRSRSRGSAGHGGFQRRRSSRTPPRPLPILSPGTTPPLPSWVHLADSRGYTTSSSSSSLPPSQRRQLDCCPEAGRAAQRPHTACLRGSGAHPKLALPHLQSTLGLLQGHLSLVLNPSRCPLPLRASPRATRSCRHGMRAQEAQAGLLAPRGTTPRSFPTAQSKGLLSGGICISNPAT